MLLTYEEFADIPNKMHVFYSQAFDTLFQKHDAGKEQYQRKTYIGLARDDFKACLAAFSAMTYLQGQVSFDDKSLTTTAGAAVDYLKQRTGKIHSKLTGEQFIADLRESVCLLQQDGLNTAFVHRSFQEYFSSLFATTIHASKVKPILDQFSHRFSDSVLTMALDMDRDTVEQEWILPTLKHLASLLKLGDPESNLADRLSTMLEELELARFRTGGLEADTVVTHYGTINLDVAGPLGAILKLYSVKAAHPLDRCRWSRSIMQRWLKPEYSRRVNFSKLSHFLSADIKFDAGSRYKRLSIKLTSGNDWWLREAGHQALYIHLNDAFRKIRKDIEAREQRRSNILLNFVKIGSA
jgi:hypothetical protein